MKFYFLYYLTYWQPLGYAIAFFGMIFEGDVVLFAVAFLTSQRIFSLPLMLITVFAGVIVGDTLWYWLGVRLRNHDNRFIRFLERMARPFDEQLQQKFFRTLLLTKFMYGIHHTILIRAGMLGLRLKKFVERDIQASIIWVGIVWGLGYGASASLSRAEHYLRFAELALLFAFIGFVFLESILRFILQKNISRSK